MIYSRFLTHLKSYLGKSSASSIGSHEYFVWAREYLNACTDLQMKNLWPWDVTYVDSTADSDGFITLPYKSANYPVLISDTQDDGVGSPVLGMTREYNLFVYNQSASSKGFTRFIPDLSTSAEESCTATTYTSGTKTISGVSGVSWTTNEHAGKAVRFNGEETWYLIASNTASALVLDRSYHLFGDNSETQTPVSGGSTSFDIEPAGCPKLYFPYSSGSLRIWYPKRFRPAVNESDDCGWDSRLDPIMPKMIAGYIIVTTSGDAETRQRGHTLIEYARQSIGQLLANLRTPGSVDTQRFGDPSAPFGPGFDYTGTGIVDDGYGRGRNIWLRRG